MRRLLYACLTHGAVLPWALGMLAFRVAYMLAVWGGRLRPEAQPPNCWTYAARRFDALQVAWREAGSDPQMQPYVVGRTSRHWPEWVWHVLVSHQRDHDTGEMPLESFKPDAPSSARWWQLLRRTRFDGHVERGD